MDQNPQRIQAIKNLNILSHANSIHIGILIIRFSCSGKWSDKYDPGYEKTTDWTIWIGEYIYHAIKN